MEAHIRGKVARGVKEAAVAAVTARREIERRLAEVRLPCRGKSGLMLSGSEVPCFDTLAPENVLHD